MAKEYIEREILFNTLQLTSKASDAMGRHDSAGIYASAASLVAEQPAADVAPVVHERWMETPKDGWTRMECSGCGHSYYVPENINPIEWADDRNYCVKCGSRMDGGEHHAD